MIKKTKKNKKPEWMVTLKSNYKPIHLKAICCYM